MLTKKQCLNYFEKQLAEAYPNDNIPDELLIKFDSDIKYLLASTAKLDHYNIWFNIFELLNFKFQLSLVFTSAAFRNDLPITNMFDVNIKKNTPIQDILKEKIFANVAKIRWYYDNIDLSFMKNLKILELGFGSKLQQNDIAALNLTELECDSNITNVSFMKTLKILKLGYCGLHQSGIANLDLIEFHSNSYIINVSFMRNLKILYANFSILCQEGI